METLFLYEVSVSEMTYCTQSDLDVRKDLIILKTGFWLSSVCIHPRRFLEMSVEKLCKIHQDLHFTTCSVTSYYILWEDLY